MTEHLFVTLLQLHFFAGTNFVHLTNPWGLLALLAIPVIVAVHLFRQRFPELPVAGTHLWASLTEVRQAGRRLDRLPWSKSLFLEILAVIAVALALAKPQFQPAQKALHLVVVLDDSASMASRPPGQPAFRTLAIEAIEEQSLRDDVKVELTILLTGARPVMLAGPSVPFSDAETALQDWLPTATQHDPAAALELARQLAEETGKVLLITDSQPQLDDPVDYISVGQSLDNVGFTASRFDPQITGRSESVSLRIRNFSTKSKKVDVVVSAVEQTAKATNDGESQKTSFELTTIKKVSHQIDGQAVQAIEVSLPSGCRHVKATLSTSRDSLATDNFVELLVPPEQTIRYAFDFPANDFRIAAIQRALAAIDFVNLSDIDDAHLVFGTLDSETTTPRQWLISLAEESPSGNDERLDIAGPYVMDRRNPLLTGITLDGVISAGIAEGNDNSPLITAGDRILLGQVPTSNGQSAWHLNLDLNRSTLIDSPDWPILISNFVTQRRRILPGLNRSNFRIGETVRFLNETNSETEATDSRQWKLQSAADRSINTRIIGGAQVDVGPHLLQIPGVYEITADDKVVDRFAVNFHNATESNLLPLSPGQNVARLNTETLSTVDSPFTWVTILAIGLAVLAIVANWRDLSAT